MKNTYCTLFNYGYLARGLALYRSMERCIQHFHLYILAMDERTRYVLEDLKLDSVTILYYKELMNGQVKEALENREGTSFYWTFTPVLLEYILEEKHEEWCTYVDADCWFMKDPGKVFDLIENGGYSVGIVEHRFRLDGSYDKNVREDGRFNVAFNTFRNDSNSISILREWKDQCLESCTDKPSGDVFGDQLYLNEWPDKYSGVYIVQEEGIDVAPWNVNNYRVRRCKGAEGAAFSIMNDGGKTIIYMYHFHALNFISKNLVSLNLWNPRPRSEATDLFELYRAYISELKAQQVIVDTYSLDIDDPLQEPGFIAKFVAGITKIKEKYADRTDKSIIHMIRNVMWV